MGMKITDMIKMLEGIVADEGDLDVYYVDDQYRASPVFGVYVSDLAEGADFNGDGLGPVHEDDLENYDTFRAVELQ